MFAAIGGGVKPMILEVVTIGCHRKTLTIDLGSNLYL